MSTLSYKKKNKQLGRSYGSAVHHLKKAILFSLAKELGRHYCFQCGAEIENIEEFSIEHKIPWLDSINPSGLFFDLENIAFSHLKCNVDKARPMKKSHPNTQSYKEGCRCDECKEIQRLRIQKYRSRSV